MDTELTDIKIGDTFKKCQYVKFLQRWKQYNKEKIWNLKDSLEWEINYIIKLPLLFQDLLNNLIKVHWSQLQICDVLVIRTTTMTFKIRRAHLAPVYSEEKIIGTTACQLGNIKCSLNGSPCSSPEEDRGL